MISDRTDTFQNSTTENGVALESIHSRIEMNIYWAP